MCHHGSLRFLVLRREVVESRVRCRETLWAVVLFVEFDEPGIGVEERDLDVERGSTVGSAGPFEGGRDVIVMVVMVV